MVICLPSRRTQGRCGWLDLDRRNPPLVSWHYEPATLVAVADRGRNHQKKIPKKQKAFQFSSKPVISYAPDVRIGLESGDASGKPDGAAAKNDGPSHNGGGVYGRSD